MKQEFSDYVKMLNSALDTVSPTWIDLMVEEIQRVAKSGGRLFVCGNGGSAAISEHLDRKSTRLNSSHSQQSRMPSSA